MSKVRDTKSFIIKSNIIHNSLYDYSNSKYIKNKDNIYINCKIHGEFKSTSIWESDFNESIK